MRVNASMEKDRGYRWSIYGTLGLVWDFGTSGYSGQQDKLKAYSCYPVDSFNDYVRFSYYFLLGTAVDIIRYKYPRRMERPVQKELTNFQSKFPGVT